MKRSSRLFIAAVVALLLSNCSESREAWKGWIDFNSEASFKSAICGKTSTENAVQDLFDEDNALIRTMYVASGYWVEMQERVECINEAKNCEEFWRCQLPAGAEPCDDTTFEEICEGDTTVQCLFRNVQGEQDHFIRRTDCSGVPGGGTCVLNGDGAQCEYNQCKPDATNPRCEGDIHLYCEHHEFSEIYWMMDCSVMNLQCLAEGMCGVPGAISCDDQQKVLCDGPFIHSCRSPLGQYSQDCREFHPEFVCFLDEFGDPRCGMAEGSWECEENEDRWCDSSVLKVCIYGKIVSFDCSSFNDSVCENDECIIPL